MAKLLGFTGPSFLAARYRPRFGFTEAADRLSGRIHPRIVWAKDD